MSQYGFSVPRIFPYSGTFYAVGKNHSKTFSRCNLIVKFATAGCDNMRATEIFKIGLKYQNNDGIVINYFRLDSSYKLHSFIHKDNFIKN